MKLEEYIQKCLELDLNLTPRTLNGFTLRTRIANKGSNFVFIKNSNDTLLKGYSHTVLKLLHEFRVYTLEEGNETLIENSGLEMFDHYFPYVQAHGKVLVA